MNFKSYIINRKLNIHPLRQIFEKTGRLYIRIRKINRRLLLPSILIILVALPTLIYSLINAFSTQAWYNTSWQYRKEITIDNTQVSGSGSHTDFPILISHTDTALRDNAQADGDDILFTSSDGTTKLSHEIEKYTSSTGEIIAWVKIPSLSTSADTNIYIYYGNEGATSQQDAENVWDTSYKMIQHLQETSGTHLDSTVTNSDSDTVQVTAQGTATGKVNGADEFDNVNDYIQIPDSNDLDLQTMTISAWIKGDTWGSSNDEDRIVFKGAGSHDANSYTLDIKDSKVSFAIDQQIPDSGGSCNTTQKCVYGATTLSTGTWYHVTAVFDGTTGLTVYLNGSQNGSNTLSSSATVDANANPVKIGGRSDSDTFDGIIDEVRISNTNRSGDWVATEYNNQNSPGTFYSLGAQETSSSETLLLHWKLNDAQGTTAQDSSTGNNSGTVSGAVWKEKDSCVENGCLEFDGSNDSVSRADDADLDFSASDSFSIGGWFRHPPSSSGTDVLLAKYESTGADGGYKIYMDADGDIICGIDDDNASFPEDSAASTTAIYDDNQWHHVMCVKNGTTSLTLFINGVQIAQDSSISATGTLANNDTFYVGIDGDGTSNPWKGFIDNIKVYRTALSSNEIKAEYNSGAAVLGAKDEAFLTNGLVGHWKMDESSWTNDCSTTSVTDSSGNDNNGKSCPSTTGSTTPLAGKFGNAGDFDGSDDYVDLDNPSSLQTTEDFTIAYWIKQDDQNTGNERPITHGQGSINGWIFLIRGTAQAEPGILYFQTDNNGTISSATRVDDAQWHHVVVTSNNRNLTMYIDGVAEDTGSFDSAISYTADLFIGTSHANTEYFDGKIDEFRHYNRALLSGEVSRLYNWAPGPIGYWNFEEGSGTSATDRSGNDNTGTVSGGATYTQGKYGKALEFDGSDDTVDTGTNSVPHTSRTGTWTVWFYPTSTPSNDFGQAILSLDNAGQDANDHMSLIYNNNNAVFFRHRVGGEAFPYHINGPGSGAGSVPLNTWTHISLVQDGVAPKIYINGELKGTSSAGSDLTSWHHTFNFAKKFLINAHLSTTYLAGKIDEVKVYNYPLTPQQITEDMNAGHPTGGSPIASQVGYWKFDEGYGTSTSNSGNGGSTLNGTITGATWSNDGKVKKALNFDANDDRVVISSSALLTGDAEGSVSVWVKPDNADSTQDGIYAEDISGGSVLVLEKTTSNTFSFAIRQSDGTWITVEDASTLSANNWYHLTGTFNQTTGTLKLYVNGVLKDSDTTWDSTFTSSVNSVLIGDRTNTGTFGFGGLIDEAKVYSSELTSEQVKLDYNSGKSTQFGVLGTDSSGNPSNAQDRHFCPPGDTTVSCAPIGYWDFEEGTGTTANDKSGNGNSGSITNAAWTTGKYGKGLSFDGSGDYVTINDNDSLDITSAGSMCTWFVADSYATNAQEYFRKDGNYILRTSGSADTPSSRLLLYYWDGTNIRYVDAERPSTGKWHHVCAVVSGNDASALYIDGVLVDSTASTSTTSGRTLTNNLSLGGSSDNAVITIDGKMDDARIYNYALSPAQVAWNYNKGKPQAHYKFDECSGSTASDSSGNSNSGTINADTLGNTSVGSCTTSATSMRYNGRIGKRNYALDFDGTDDRVSVTSNSSINSLTDMTISAWIYTEGDGGGTFGRIINKGTTNSGTNMYYSLHLGNTSTLTWRAGYSTTVGQWNRGSLDLLNKWVHVAVVYTHGDTTSDPTFYINGVEYSPAFEQTPAGSAVSDTTDLVIGDWGNGTRSFDGKIDDVRIYNYRLTSQQIKNVMNDGAIRYGPLQGSP